MDSKTTSISPLLKPFFDLHGVLVIDGGLATHLETLGCDLRHELWSAKTVIEKPELVRQAHLDYFLSGADCATSASYQASIPGFCKFGLTAEQARDSISRSVQLALEARELFWENSANRIGRVRPLVAASVGPYGASLANGAEYVGDYEINETESIHWHRERWHVLADSGADLLGCETIPSLSEGRALAHLLAETPDTQAWVSFSCRDEKHICDGTPIAESVKPFAEHPQVVAIGINCTAPTYAASLIREISQVTTKPIIAYPNSGETYVANLRQWQGLSEALSFGEMSELWHRAGATLIGGCCRTTPEHIHQIRQRLIGQ
jgi:homocysteine S-methyltransferase